MASDIPIMRQLNNTLYSERVKKYQVEHSLKEDDYSFSEQQIVDYCKADGINIKIHILDALTHSITSSKDNKLKDYVDFEGRAKNLPISCRAYYETILSSFISTKLILKTPIEYKSDEGLNPREMEINQIIQLLNILADRVYVNKFIPEIGVNRIEKRIIDRKDADISDEHLIAFRMSKEEILHNWLQYLKMVIKAYFTNTGKIINDDELFQHPFDEQLWKNIDNFIRNLKELPLWKDRGMASTVFAGKNTYDYWKTIFETSKTPDNAIVLAKSLNFMDMIKSNEAK